MKKWIISAIVGIATITGIYCLYKNIRKFVEDDFEDELDEDLEDDFDEEIANELD